MIRQAVLKYIRADLLAEALLPKLKEVEDAEKLSALKLRMHDWNRHTKRWKRPPDSEVVLASRRVQA